MYMKKIDISTKKYPNKFALVDDEDYKYLSQWKWSWNTHQYAVRFKYLGKINGKNKYRSIYMHRVLNNTPEGFETDHINRNKLDNRKSNLRTATKSLNGRNKNISNRNNSGTVGVSFHKKTNMWRARMNVDKRELSFGYYKNINDAVMARKEAEKIYG